MLPDQAIQEFKEIYYKQYGVKLSDKEASFRANNLVNLYRAVYTNNYRDPKDTTKINEN